jgi:hypothetical protein
MQNISYSPEMVYSATVIVIIGLYLLEKGDIEVLVTTL